MAVNTDNTEAFSKNVFDWLARISGIAGLLINILSLFLEEKSAKQVAFGLAFIIPFASLWYQRRGHQPDNAGPRKTQTAAANRFLKTYLVLFDEDKATRIPYNRIQWLESTASTELLSKDASKELLKLSKQAYYWITGTNVFALASLLITLYIYVVTSYAFNPIDYLFGRSLIQKENPFIALTRGDGTMIFGAETPDLVSGEQSKNDNMPMEDFFIQKTEVTNSQFRTCRRASGCAQDPSLNPTSPRYYENAEYDDYPVVGVTAFQAREFCNWLGGDLPTSEQWERAARGLNGRAWPWKGNDLKPDFVNLYPSDQIFEATALPDGASPEKVLNLVGNVAEWTSTQLITNDGGASFLPELWNGSDTDAALVVRGGSWGLEMSRITEVQIALPEHFTEFIGFRCIN